MWSLVSLSASLVWKLAAAAWIPERILGHVSGEGLQIDARKDTGKRWQHLLFVCLLFVFYFPSLWILAITPSLPQPCFQTGMLCLANSESVLASWIFGLKGSLIHGVIVLSNPTGFSVLGFHFSGFGLYFQLDSALFLFNDFIIYPLMTVQQAALLFGFLPK